MTTRAGRGSWVTAYYVAWTLLWSVVAAAGVLVAVARLGVVATLTVAFVFAVLASGRHYLPEVSRATRDRAARDRTGPRAVLTTLGVGAVAGAGFVGWCSAVGGAALVLAAVAVLTMPGLASSVGHWGPVRALRPLPTSHRADVWGSAAPPPDSTMPNPDIRPTTDEQPEPVFQPPLRELSDAELCRA